MTLVTRWTKIANGPSSRNGLAELGKVGTQGREGSRPATNQQQGSLVQTWELLMRREQWVSREATVQAPPRTPLRLKSTQPKEQKLDPMVVQRPAGEALTGSQESDEPGLTLALVNRLWIGLVLTCQLRFGPCKSLLKPQHDGSCANYTCVGGMRRSQV